MYARSEKQAKGKRKAAQSGFYKLRNAARDMTLSESGRRCVAMTLMVDRDGVDVPDDVADAAGSTPAAYEHVPPVDMHDPAFDSSRAPEAVDGLSGIAVVATEKAKRYASSVGPYT